MTAPWRSPLARALHRNRSKPHSRYLQLATVTPEGYPANRTVVFRGFIDSGDRLKFITDLRSEKISQIQHQSRSEACWYFTKTREQFRLAGTLNLVTLDEGDPSLQLARNTTWQNLSDAARAQFACATTGNPQEDLAGFDQLNASPVVSRQGTVDRPTPSPEEPLENFCLLLLTPTKVDHLELRGEPQNRFLYYLQADNTWSLQAVNP